MVVVPPRRLSPSLGHGIGNPQRLSMASVASTTTAPLHDVAVALEHTHDDICMVHGDVSASKYVLLDEDGRTRLCDLGSGCEGTFPATVAPAWGASAMGSPVYADPFFLRTGIMSKKSDLYGFGVLLFEAVTGSPATGAPGQDVNGKYLAPKVPRVTAVGVAGLMDGRLGDDHDTVEAGDVAPITVDRVVAQVRAALAEKVAMAIAGMDDNDMRRRPPCT